MLYPFALVFIFISIGIVLSRLFDFYIPVFIALPLIIIPLILKRELGLLSFVFALILFGYTISYKSLDGISHQRNISLACNVNSIPKVYQDFVKFSCKVKNSSYTPVINKDINVKVFSKEPFKLDIFYRTGLKLKGNLFVFNKNLYFKTKEFEIVSQSPFFITLWEFKRGLIYRFKEKTPDSNLFALGSALIFGEKSFLTDDLRNIYVKSGLIHLLAISGLHVGMLILVLLLLLYPLGRKLSYSITAVILVFYPLFTGLQPPVLRASLMGILLLIGKIKNFQINSLNILFFVGTAIIVLSPDMLFSPSFQLSFIAVLGIILGLSMFNITGKNFLEMVLGALWVSVVAMLFTTPIVMYYFGQFAPVSIIATPIATIPLYPYIFLSVLNILTNFSFDILVNLMNKFGAIFLSISVFFSELDFYLIGFSPKLIFVVVYLLILIVLFVWNGNKLIRLALISLSTTIFMVFSYSKEVKDFIVYKLKGGYIVKLPNNECLIYKKRFNPFIFTKLNKLNCQEKIFVFNPRRRKIPDGFDKYIPINSDYRGIKFIKNGRKILIKINDKFINQSDMKVLE